MRPDNWVMRKNTRFHRKIATAAGEINGRGVYADNHFEAHLRTDDFDLGQVMADTTRFGLLSAELSARGERRDQATFKTSIKHFRFERHNYSNVKAEGAWDGRRLSATLSSDDPDLRLKASGSVSLPHPLDGINIRADVSALSPHALGWTQRYPSTTFSGHLTANVSGASWTNAEGQMRLESFRMATADTTCLLDTLSLDIGGIHKGIMSVCVVISPQPTTMAADHLLRAFRTWPVSCAPTCLLPCRPRPTCSGPHRPEPSAYMWTTPVLSSAWPICPLHSRPHSRPRVTGPTPNLFSVSYDRRNMHRRNCGRRHQNFRTR